MEDFRFTNEHRISELGNVIDVLRRPRLWIPETDYPDYDLWLDRTESQLYENRKRAMLAYWGRNPVGTVIYQRHQTKPGTIEIKNISVAPEASGRYVGSFLLRNTMLESAQDFPDCTQAVVDTKITNNEMIAFLIRHGFELSEILDLYELGAAEDAVFTKNIAIN